MADVSLQPIASRLVKEIAMFDGDISPHHAALHDGMLDPQQFGNPRLDRHSLYPSGHSTSPDARQRPFQFAGRFSPKAVMPSFLSSVATRIWNRRRSVIRPRLR